MFGFLNRETGDTIHVNDMDNLIGKVELIDIREPNEYKRGSLVSAKNIPMNELLQATDKYLDKEKTYYIICQSGGRSSMACKAMTKQGYKVINVGGGVGSYVGTKRK